MSTTTITSNIMVTTTTTATREAAGEAKTCNGRDDARPAKSKKQPRRENGANTRDNRTPRSGQGDATRSIARGNISRGNITRGNAPRRDVACDSTSRGNTTHRNRKRGEISRGRIASDNAARDRIPCGDAAQENAGCSNITRGNVVHGNIARGKTTRRNIMSGDASHRKIACDNKSQDNEIINNKTRLWWWHITTKSRQTGSAASHIRLGQKGAVREGIRWPDRGLVSAALTRMVVIAVTPNDNNPTRSRTKQHNNSVMMYAWDTQECYNVSCAKNIIFKSAHSKGRASDGEHCPRITRTTPRLYGRLHMNAYHVGLPARGSTPRDISGESNTTTPNTPSENPTEAKPQTNPTGMTEGTGRSVTINGYKHNNPEVNGDTTVINMAPNDTKVEDQTEHTGIITGTDQMATKNKYKYNASGTDDDAMDTHLTLHKTVTGNIQDTARQVNGPLIKLTNHNNTISANVETQPRNTYWGTYEVRGPFLD